MKKLVLLVDDDRVTNLINRKYIESLNSRLSIMEFLSAGLALDYICGLNSGTDELKIFILLDLNMPEIDGWEFLQILEDQFSHLNITVHVVSSSIDPDDQEKARNVELVNSFISKPLNKKKSAILIFLHNLSLQLFSPQSPEQ